MRWLVEVFEPSIDPGGYQASIEVEGENEAEAQRAALEQAAETWPGHTGLAVYSIKNLEPMPQTDHAVAIVLEHGPECEGCVALREICFDAIAHTRRKRELGLSDTP